MGSGYAVHGPCGCGGTVIVNLSASNETVGKDSYRADLVKSTSARLICGYVYSSAGEGESTQDLVFNGHNMIAENGTILLRPDVLKMNPFTGKSTFTGCAMSGGA